jgi:hypothetical protein
VKTIRKYFDKDGAEVTDASKAANIHELQVSDDGHVVNDATYVAEKVEVLTSHASVSGAASAGPASGLEAINSKDHSHV